MVGEIDIIGLKWSAVTVGMASEKLLTLSFQKDQRLLLKNTRNRTQTISETRPKKFELSHCSGTIKFKIVLSDACNAAIVHQLWLAGGNSNNSF